MSPPEDSRCKNDNLRRQANQMESIRNELKGAKERLTDLESRNKILVEESEADLNALIENIQGAVWSVDRDFRIIALNSYFKKSYKVFSKGRDSRSRMDISSMICPIQRCAFSGRPYRSGFQMD